MVGGQCGFGETAMNLRALAGVMVCGDAMLMNDTELRQALNSANFVLTQFRLASHVDLHVDSEDLEDVTLALARVRDDEHFARNKPNMSLAAGVLHTRLLQELIARETASN